MTPDAAHKNFQIFQIEKSSTDFQALDFGEKDGPIKFSRSGK